MTQVGPPKYDPIPIGEVAIPPFARLPDPLTMFARRAERLKAVADGHQLQSFLLFIADLSDIQHRLQKGLSAAELPALDAIARARQFGMPPLDRLRFTRDAAMDATWERLFAMADDIAMPDAARLALRRVKAADPADEAAMMSAVLLTAIPGERLAEHVFVAAALQVHFARSPHSSMPTGWCLSATAPVRPVAVHRYHLFWSAGAARTERASASVRYAARCGIIRASDARCAARPKGSPTRRSRVGRQRSKRKPASPAVVT
jgi:hypothetical protein